MSAAAESRTLVLADLHMAAGRHDVFGEDDHLVRFLDGPARGEGTLLLVLGDLFDFSRVELPGRRGRRLDTSVDGALEKLDAIAAAHPAPFQAFRGALAAGTRAEIVVGNHDLELMLPPVAARLCAMLGADVAVHPWLVHRPGLLYAEHGQQHHEINRVFEPLRLADGQAAPVTVGTVAGEWALEGRDRGLPLGATARLALGLGRWGMRGRRRGYGERIEEHAAGVALPPSALAEIDALGPRGPMGAAARLGRRLSARAEVPYMESALARVHEVLVSHDAAVPYYVAGHTHQVVDTPLAAGPGAPRYLSPGTWSDMRPPGAREGLHYVEVEPGRARVVRWDA